MRAIGAAPMFPARRTLTADVQTPHRNLEEFAYPIPRIEAGCPADDPEPNGAQARTARTTRARCVRSVEELQGALLVPLLDRRRRGLMHHSS